MNRSNLKVRWSVGVVFALSACGVPTGGSPSPQDTLVSASQALSGSNGLGSNGLGTNGLGTNGLGTNGLGTNGLGTNGLGTNGLGTNGLGTDAAFKTWFNAGIPARDELMNYLVKCALGPGQTTKFTDSAGGVHSWTGNFGLATSWFTSNASTTAQQEWVSACLMSLVNANGNHITVSLRGNNPALTTTPAELATMKGFDGAFFGNIFNSTATKFACYGSDNVNKSVAMHYLGRGCAYQDSCNLTQVGPCSSYCTAAPPGSNYAWSSCTYGGHTYNNVVNIYVPTVIEGESGTPVAGTNSGQTFTNASTGASDGNVMYIMNPVVGSSGAGLTLPLGSLPAGTYTVELWANQGNTSEAGYLTVNGVAQPATNFTFTNMGYSRTSHQITVPGGATTLGIYLNTSGSTLLLDTLFVHP